MLRCIESPRSSFNLIAAFIVATLSFPSIGVALDCDPLAPQRPVQSEIKAKLEGGTGGLLLEKLGSLEFEGEIQRIESDLVHAYPEADKLHMFNSVIFMLCSMLNDSSFDDARKFEKFEKLTTKWMLKSAEVIVDQIQTEDPLKKRTAIEIGIKHHDPFIREMAIEDALKSESDPIRSIALRNLLVEQKSISGFICEDEEGKNCRYPFGFNIEQIITKNSSLSFSGEFSGSVFRSGSSSTVDGSGTLVGTKFNINSRYCTLDAVLSEEKEMIGYFDCGSFEINREASYGPHPVRIKMH